MVKQRFGLLGVFIFCAALGSAAQSTGVDIGIRFFDKRVYHVEDRSILVQITIANRGPSAYRFKLADDRSFSVDFDLKTMSNRTVEPAAALIRKRTANQQVFFREITVESGESFSFVEDLRDYVDLRQSGGFIVQAKVYPELNRGAPAAPLESNRLNLNLRPPAIPGPGGIPLAMDEETNAVLVREKLPPDQVVDYMLSARQKSQWEKFFLYLDLEAMISRDGTRQRQWRAEPEEGRQRMLARYREELQSAVVDTDISTIPRNFTIERTTYNAEEGTVVVLEYFSTGNYIEKKQYSYTLRRQDDIWTIVDYTVLNLGTE
jgi:hypothetical protein